MKLPSLWSGGRSAPSQWSHNRGLIPDAFWSMQSELEDLLRAFDRLPSLRTAASAPKVNVAESKDSFDISVELPGVDEKDIQLSVEDNQLILSGEKKQETQRDEKDWHVEEFSYGSFYRSIPLPFRPDDNDIDAALDRGVLRIQVKKPAEVQQQGPKTIRIKAGQPDQPAPQRVQEQQQDQPKAAE
jgi:HSP20 family protein